MQERRNSIANALELRFSCINPSTLRPEQNGQHFADNIFICIYLNKDVWILNEINYQDMGFFFFVSNIVEICINEYFDEKVQVLNDKVAVVMLVMLWITNCAPI